MADIVNFKTSDIDFDGIANALRNYLSYQTEFTDYNFQGSALSVLVNLLAYNTHYNTVYDNFAVNEAFLDSAYKRESVISHASMLNYIPRSAIAATAKVNLNVYDDSVLSNSTVVLPKYSMFTSTIENKTYSFYTNSAYSFERSGSYYSINDVELKQGTYITIEREYTGDSAQKFVLDNDNVDIETLTVKVQQGVDISTFTRAENILDVTSDSKIYFLTMNSRGQYQIQFGSGMLGYSLSAGDIVYITYLNTADDPTAANGASSFVYQGTLQSLGFSTLARMTTSCTQRASGGTPAEDTESIRTLAPRVYCTQNRCVTASDYQSLLKKMYPNIKSISVWGGQDMVPPQYGKVFISIIPKDDLILSDIEKNKILDLLKDKKEITKLVEFYDPTYITILIESTVHYNSSKTTLTASDLATIVRATINDYGDRNLSEFGNVMRYSALTRDIDRCDPAISNNNTKIRLQMHVEPYLYTKSSYTIELNNPIYRPTAASESVKSTGFYCDEGGEDRLCYIDDEPVSGRLRLYWLDSDNKKVLIKYIGTVDYKLGSITIDSLNVLSLSAGSWLFTFNPSSNDVVASKNQFAVIDNSQLVITMIDDDTSKTYQQIETK